MAELLTLRCPNEGTTGEKGTRRRDAAIAGRVYVRLHPKAVCLEGVKKVCRSVCISEARAGVS
jgi:hypothetical protein